MKFGDWLGVPEPVMGFARGDGHFLFVLACVAAGSGSPGAGPTRHRRWSG